MQVLEKTPHSSEVLAWVEEAAIENMAGKHKTAEWIAQQASLTLTVLLAALGGSLTFAAKLFEPNPSAVSKGAAVLCIYLALVAVFLVRRCLMVEPIDAIHNEPKNLLSFPGKPLDELRRMELDAVQERIESARERNEFGASVLNRTRLMLAAGAPIVFAIATAYFWR
jgi:hypothetical protein